ncbi:MAG TPA: glycosyltransferase family 4 protein [Candidatus Omnitrophota bacterium]|nr:glycosyltransferase family 4 protein [Candidatus Omnitrophota bacterium]HRZ15557.1 glycosyltransferase family 4 protein [Candidatus Omnitrophota bacterium]
MRRFKVAMVIGQFAPIVGGAERQCLKLSKELLKRGHEVRVYTACNYPARPGWDTVEGVEVFRVGYPVVVVKDKKIAGLGGLCRYGMAYELVRASASFELMHVHQGLWPVFSAAVAKKIARKPVVCKIANSGVRFDLAMLKKDGLAGFIGERLVKRQVDVFVATSAAVKTDLRSAGVLEDKIASIPNGVEIGEKIAHHPAEKTVFVFVGSLTAKKNAAAMIESARQLQRAWAGSFEMLLVGAGPERMRLEQQARAAGVGGSVRFCGATGAVSRFLSGAHVFVLPSLTEGLSNAALEAMAAGLPLILSDQGGNPDLIDKGEPFSPGVLKGSNGFLCDIHSPRALSGAMEYCLRHPVETIAMGLYSRHLAESRYSMGRTAELYEMLYGRLLEQTGKAAY